MIRIDKPSSFAYLGDQVCQEQRPALILPPTASQINISQINIVLPDSIRFDSIFYPNGTDDQVLQEIDVQVLGENAHRICFMTGIRTAGGGCRR